MPLNETDNQSMDTLSIIIITYNEEPNIEICLQSITWADEIIVVDCGSTDRTLEICNRYEKVSLFQEDREGSGAQKQHALDKANSMWVLNLDADESVSESLRLDIQNILECSGQIDGYHVPRENYFLARHIKHAAGWGCDRPLRLFRRVKTSVTKTQVHETFVVDGSTGHLESPLLHQAYKSLYQYIEKLNEYTSIEVRNRLKAQPGRKITWIHILLAPMGTFRKMFVLHKGYRDGIQGLLLCLLSSVSVMLGYAKTWEYKMYRNLGNNEFPPIRTQEVRTRQPGYNQLIKGGDQEFTWEDR